MEKVFDLTNDAERLILADFLEENNREEESKLARDITKKVKWRTGKKKTEFLAQRYIGFKTTKAATTSAHARGFTAGSPVKLKDGSWAFLTSITLQHNDQFLLLPNKKRYAINSGNPKIMEIMCSNS